MTTLAMSRTAAVPASVLLVWAYIKFVVHREVHPFYLRERLSRICPQNSWGQMTVICVSKTKLSDLIGEAIRQFHGRNTKITFIAHGSWIYASPTCINGRLRTLELAEFENGAITIWSRGQADKHPRRLNLFLSTGTFEYLFPDPDDRSQYNTLVQAAISILGTLNTYEHESAYSKYSENMKTLIEKLEEALVAEKVAKRKRKKAL